VEAQEEYKKALKIEPNHTLTRHNWGSTYLLAYQSVGKPLYLDATVKQFKEALRINQNDASWHYDLGNTYCHQLNFTATVEE
jgi:tetratricopeptide (TPR) repeat protein